MTDNADTTSDLIAAAKGGDTAAFGRLVKQFQNMLMGFAAYRIPDHEEAREAVQDTFIRAYEQLADFRDGADFGTWLRAICRFMVLTRIRNAIRERAHKNNYATQIDLLVLKHCEEGADETTSDTLAHLRSCLEQLGDASRTLVNDRYAAGMNSRELAEKTGRTVTWVTSTLSRVRKTLRNCIEAKKEEETS